MQHSWHQVSQILIIFQEYLSPETYDHIGYIGAIFIQFRDSIVVLDFFIGPTIRLIYYVDQLASVSYILHFTTSDVNYSVLMMQFLSRHFIHIIQISELTFSFLCLLQKLPVRVR